MSDSATPWTAACQALLSFTISWRLLRFMSTELVILSNHLILCHPLLHLPSIFPSIRVFSNESARHIRIEHKKSTLILISRVNMKLEIFILPSTRKIIKTNVNHHHYFIKERILILKKQKIHSYIKDDPLNWVNQCYVKFTTFSHYFSPFIKNQWKFD